ncbi:hypothetical protein DPMN_155798 [Dreissena polymorpha]|uniref:Uncharacterized protein n=1 Tax=Dreissena polymorpha TaxID=45954 RepID=A0A9D4JB90_DREPO|nr:hypothetical protein DPMN_155798 [Dreissena polymorpha]
MVALVAHLRNIISTNILTKFLEHWTKNVTSRVLTRKTAPPPGSHVFQQTRTIFKHIQYITINMTSRVLTRLTATPSGGHVFHSTGTIFELFQDIIGTHVLTKFHEDWIKNVTSRETATPPGSHFHEDWTINVTSRVLTRFFYSHIWKTAPPPGGHVFHQTETIFKLVQDFIGAHIPTKFHADWTKNVTSRVLTRKTATPPGSHVFQPTRTILELVQDIIETHVLTKFHEYWTINVTFRVLTR